MAFNSKEMLPLTKRGEKFIYVDDKNEMFYLVTEPDMGINLSNITLLLSIAGISLVKFLENAYMKMSSVFVDALLLFIVFVVVLILTRVQFKKWEQMITVEPFEVSNDSLDDILGEANKIVYQNRNILLITSFLTLACGIFFIILASVFCLILFSTFWYVECLLYPNLKLRRRIVFIKKMRNLKL